MTGGNVSNQELRKEDWSMYLWLTGVIFRRAFQGSKGKPLLPHEHGELSIWHLTRKIFDGSKDDSLAHDIHNSLTFVKNQTCYLTAEYFRQSSRLQL